MNNFFKSRFFIITLLVAMFLCIVPTTLAVMGQGGFVRGAAVTIISPFQKLAGFVGESLGGFGRYFTHYDELKEENERLKEELAAIKNENYEAVIHKNENEWLRGFLELKNEHESFELTDAKIVGRETTNTRIVYTLDRGSGAGIEKNMPVITPHGLVGHIVEVGLTWSKAVALTDGRSHVGIYTERAGSVGVMSGDIELSIEGKCEASFEEGGDIAVGDRVFTSGLGSVYPEGLAVGCVTEVYLDEYDRTLRAVIEPFVSFDDMSGVMILRGFAEESGE